MRSTVKVASMLVVFAVLAICTVVPDAQSAIFSTTYYNINYFNSSQLSWARRLAPYLGRAHWAARTTVGYNAMLGKINIFFTYQNNGAAGWVYGGQQNLFLNTKYFSSWDKWGSVTAHETAHILFYNYTGAHRWNPNLIYYRSFFTESLSWYAGDYVYNYFRFTRSSAFNQIRANLKYFAGRTGLTMSWYGAGFYYRNGSGNLLNQAIWSLKAAGWFLTNGRLTSSSPVLMRTLYAMRRLSSFNGFYLRSGNYGTARSWFEYSFRYGFGRYANAGWIYTGSTNQAYKDTRFLYGIFWYYFYS